MRPLPSQAPLDRYEGEVPEDVTKAEPDPRIDRGPTEIIDWSKDTHHLDVVGEEDAIGGETDVTFDESVDGSKLSLTVDHRPVSAAFFFAPPRGPPMADTPLANTARVGRILDAEPFEEARTPGLVKLVIDLGDEEVRSAAQLALNYDLAELVGRQVLCVTDLGTVDIAGFESQVLTVGVPGEDGNPVLVAPDRDVPLGGTLY